MDNLNATYKGSAMNSSGETQNLEKSKQPPPAYNLQSWFSTVVFPDKIDSFGHSLRKLCIHIINSQSLSYSNFIKFTNKHIKQLIFNSEVTNNQAPNFPNIFIILQKKHHIYINYKVKIFTKRNNDLTTANKYILIHE